MHKTRIPRPVCSPLCNWRDNAREFARWRRALSLAMPCCLHARGTWLHTLSRCGGLAACRESARKSRRRLIFLDVEITFPARALFAEKHQAPLDAGFAGAKTFRRMSAARTLRFDAIDEVPSIVFQFDIRNRCENSHSFALHRLHKTRGFTSVISSRSKICAFPLPVAYSTSTRLLFHTSERA